jgi:hypothetical protein
MMNTVEVAGVGPSDNGEVGVDHILDLCSLDLVHPSAKAYSNLPGKIAVKVASVVDEQP